MKSVFLVIVLIFLSVGAVFGFDGNAKDHSADEKAIRAHIELIFQAYINRDREKVKATHGENWRGFLSNSKTIIRGIDGYMATADGQGMFNPQNPWRLTHYKFIDFDLVFYGDTAVVSYIAELFWKTPADKGSYKLRSVDVYAKEKGAWNQVASNIGPLPLDQADSTELRPITPQMRSELMKSRDEVWQAFFSNDTVKLQKLIPKEVVAINPGEPKFADQAAIFAAAKSIAQNGTKLIKIEFPTTEIQVYGSTIIMYSDYVYDLETRGKRQIVSGRATEIFVLRNGNLENVGWHLDLARQ